MVLHLGCLDLELHWSFWLLLGAIAAVPAQPALLLGLLAALFHELGHLAVMLLTGNAPARLTLTALGGRLKGAAFSGFWAELMALSAGAAVNLLLAMACCLAIGHKMQLFSAINLVLGCFNLLPVQGLDGGRILRLLLERRFKGNGSERRVCTILSLAVLAALWCWSIWLYGQNPQLPTLLLFPMVPTLAFFVQRNGMYD